MTELTVTRGVPGSGKSYWAKAWVAEDVVRRARIERDQLRLMLHNGDWQGRATENTVVLAQHAMIRALVQDGVSVVVSDTNLHPGVFNELEALAQELDATFIVKDFRDVPLDVCLKRNAQRTGKEFIPKHVILDMYNKYIKE
jgi:predicted kinase